MDMSKYRSLFLSDTAEHLDRMEGELLRLEGDPAAAERVNEIFRHLHSIKGMAASMQYENMALLSHRLEDLIASHREKGSRVMEDRIQLLLKGVDALRTQLEAVRQDQPPPAAPTELLLALEGELAGELRRMAAAAGGPPPAAGAGSEAGAEARFRWAVSARIDPESQVPAARAYLLLKQLEKLGRLLSCRPEIALLRQGHLPEGTLEAVLASDRPREEILALSDRVAEISGLRVEAAPPAPAGPPPAVLPTVRVQTELLDFFVDSASELTAILGQMEELAGAGEDSALRRAVRALGSVVRRLRERVMEVRLVPASVLTGRMARICRDAAEQLGKQVRFLPEGEGVGLDRSLIEVLDTPLMHLVRNAVSHGIEKPQARRAAGKQPAGEVRLGFSRTGERVKVILRDDGSGIDLERVKRKAAELGLAPDGGRDWLWDTISHPGFSTAALADRVSGRGVGLDAVRNALERAGGRLRLETWPGQGSCFSLDLPLSVAVVAVLLVECGGFQVAVPAERVERVLTLGADNYVPGPDGPRVLAGGVERPLLSLAACLGGADGDLKEYLVLRNREGELFLGVERVLAHREVVVRKPGWLLSRLGPYGGAAVLGDGQPVLVLDAEAMLERTAGDRTGRHES